MGNILPFLPLATAQSHFLTHLLLYQRQNNLWDHMVLVRTESQFHTMAYSAQHIDFWTTRR